MRYVGFLTLVFPDVLIPRGKLHEFDLDRFKDRIAQHLRRAGLEDLQIVGGIDFALTVFPNGMRVWQPHLHALVWCQLGIRRTLEILRRHTKISELVPDPMDLKPVTGDIPSVAGYTLKAYFEQRTLYQSSETGETRTRHLPLPDWANRELCMYLNSQPIKAREFRMNLRRGRDGLRTLERTKKR